MILLDAVAADTSAGDRSTDTHDRVEFFWTTPSTRSSCSKALCPPLRRVRQDHSGGNHPQTCGKVERLQQTEKKWLAA